MKTQIRWMIRADMDAVFAIEEASFEHAWQLEDFHRALRQRNCIGMVADQGETVVGYMIYELHATRLHLLNFAVRHSSRRHGVGRQLVEKLLSKLSEEKRIRITCEIRERNLDAQLFFAAMGFRAVTVLRDYYEDSDEDAYLFQYRLPAEAAVSQGKGESCD